MKTQEIIDIEDKYFINTFNRVPIVLDHGEGVKVWDILTMEKALKYGI